MLKSRNLLKSRHDALALVLAVILFYVSDLGCPFKFATGISCPGCGMTRAWLAFLGGQPMLALAYHPLFWSVPAIAAIVLLRSRLPRSLFHTVLILTIIAFTVVWIVRLVTPADSNVLFSGMLTTDVVSVDMPAWLSFVQAFAP